MSLPAGRACGIYFDRDRYPVRLSGSTEFNSRNSTGGRATNNYTVLATTIAVTLASRSYGASFSDCEIRCTSAGEGERLLVEAAPDRQDVPAPQIDGNVMGLIQDPRAIRLREADATHAATHFEQVINGRTCVLVKRHTQLPEQRHQRDAEARAAHEQQGAQRAGRVRRAVRVHARPWTKLYAGKDDIIDAIQSGIINRKLVRYRYGVTGAAGRAPVISAPFRLAMYRHGLYAIGARLETPDDDVRAAPLGVFALERFSDAEYVKQHTFEIPADSRVRSVLEGAFGPHLPDAGGPHDVVVEFTAREGAPRRLARMASDAGD